MIATKIGLPLLLLALAVGLSTGAPPDDDDAPPPAALVKKQPGEVSKNPTAAAATLQLGVDELMGRGGRARHAERLAKTPIAGAVHPWKNYAAWGEELFLAGQVKKPPTGPAPSAPLSDFYQCTHCHNNRREDRILSKQDPDDRFAYILEAPKGDPRAPLRMQPGTTLWGAVNRESFYNDSYQVYHWLLVGALPMNPKSLEDATQVCCKYCSVGRLAEPWEILALLTYCWDLEVKLGDLDLPVGVAVELARVLQAPPATRDPVAVRQARDTLGQLYLRRAGDRFTAPPEKLTSDAQGPYPDKAKFAGDPKIGERLYRLACDHCHGEGKPNDVAGADLVRNLRKFHTILAHGTQRDREAYMPMFASERLSRQQIADVLAYLKGL